MPELPEVETSVRGISSIKNKIIESIKVNQPSLRWKVDCQKLDQFQEKKVQSVYRRAKYIIISTADSSIILHLGMTGTLRIQRNDSNFFKKHDHVEIIFKNEKLIFNDPRRFGSMHFTDDFENHFLIKNLGVEPISENFSGEYLYSKIRRSNATIKSLLMNQNLVVGIGNIYANEILFDAKVRPKRRGKRILKKEATKLAESSKLILNKAIKAGGTTLQDFLSPDGNKGYFKIDLKVYGRNEENCDICNSNVKLIKQNQRATYYCPMCQR